MILNGNMFAFLMDRVCNEGNYALNIGINSGWCKLKKP